MLGTRKRTLIGASVGALLLLAGGIAYAAIPDANGTIHACYKTSNGSLRVIDPGAGGTCNSSETGLSWDSLGSHATEVSRLAGPSSVAPSPTDTTVVAANLPAGFYTVAAHTTIHSPANTESSCTLTFRAPAASLEIEVDFSDEANFGSGQSISKHNLEGVWQFGTTPVTVRLKCNAVGTWSAVSSSIIVTRVTTATIVGVTTGDPVDL
jgi:hypothetical protein